MKKHLVALIASTVLITACSDDNGFHPIDIIGNVDYKKVEVEKISVFNSGQAVTGELTTKFANAYRIPSIVTASDGKLIAICEARWESWADQSPTDVVMKIGSEDGKQWSEYVKLTDQTGTQSFMDPVAVADLKAEKVFVFTTERPNRGGNVTTSWMITIEKVDGVWTKTKMTDIGAKFNTADVIIGGFGPGSGLQMQGEKYEGRLITPVRMAKKDAAGTFVNGGNAALYSDDNGATWKLGKVADTSGEFQIAESPKGKLIYNLRTSKSRLYGRSSTGGEKWDNYGTYDNPFQIPAPEKGCHGSVLGDGDILYYSGPEGVAMNAVHDPRGRLILCKSSDGGSSWGGKPARALLYEKAAGYSCMTFLKDGSLAVLAEVGDEPGFIYAQDANGRRPAGWMRLDIFIIK